MSVEVRVDKLIVVLPPCPGSLLLSEVAEIIERSQQMMRKAMEVPPEMLNGGVRPSRMHPEMLRQQLLAWDRLMSRGSRPKVNAPPVIAGVQLVETP